MRKSDLPQTADGRPPEPALPPSIPVICDRCRAEGMAGDEAFAAIPDILDFDPVPRRAHVNNWTAEHQRAFVCALALTGSPRLAARALGRHAFGAEQLRKARGGRSFAAAWDAALDIYRERERERIHANLNDLAQTASDGPPVFAAEGAEDEDEAAARELEEARERIFHKFMALQRRHLQEIADDPEQRHAHEVVHGHPLDWEAIVKGAPAARWWLAAGEGDAGSADNCDQG